jgi:glutamate racemase
MNNILATFTTNRHSTLGIFDSGLGGLTVLKALQKVGIADHYIYVGDTAYLPYGEKTVEQLQKRADLVTSFLSTQGVSTCVIACHTLSAVAYDYLKERFPTISFIGMIEIVADYALHQSKNKRIGVLATSASINSHAHSNALIKRNKHCLVIEQSCPRIVPLIEALPYNEAAIKKAITYYVKPLLDKGVDTIILGSTHYALIKEIIQHITGPAITLISAENTLIHGLEEKPYHNKTDCYVTGDKISFQEKAHILANINLKVKSVIL